MVMGQTVGSADLVVIGAGPGGYVAAIRAAQLGKKVFLIEKDKNLGGVCLNRGCIPSKALIHASEFLSNITHADTMGVTVDGVHFDPAKMQVWKQSIVDTLSEGIVSLCKKLGVEIIHATAYFQNSREIGLEPINPDEHLEYGAVEFKHCIIASGSVARFLPGLERDGNLVIGSREALCLDKIPEDLVVVGGGYIGVELATVYAKFGSRVTIITDGDHLIPLIDHDLTDVLAKHCEDLKIRIHYQSTAVGFDKTASGAIVHAKDKDGVRFDVVASKILVAVGRKPETAGLKLNNTKVELDNRGFIKVNDKRQTTDSHIYAIGDVVGGAMLAHKASMEGRIAAEVICGLPAAFDMRCVPAVIFSDPEMAMVGLTESEAIKAGHRVKIGKFPFKALGRALTMNQTRGFVKVIADEDTHAILGVHIVGADATDIISEAALALEMGAKVEDIEWTIHPHPTLSESFAEAVASVFGRSVHTFKK